MYSIKDKLPSVTIAVSDYYVLDFETTGLNPQTDEIIQYALLRYEDGEQRGLSTGVVKITAGSVPDFVEGLTGLTYYRIQSEGDDIVSVLTYLSQELEGKTVIFHNAPFDVAFMKQHMTNHNIPIPKMTIIDTLELSRKYIRSYNHKLGTLRDYIAGIDKLRYGHLTHLALHDALADVKVTGELYLYIRDTYLS